MTSSMHLYPYRKSILGETEKSKAPNEEEVVDLIKNWRLRDEAEDSNTDYFKKQSKILKKDNVVPEEVVEIIKEYQAEKTTYVRLNDSANEKEIRNKMDEVKEIFYETSNGMEWEKITIEAVEEMKEELKIKGMEMFNQWMQKENNFLLLRKKIISLAEQNEFQLEYTTLNNDFTKRLKDENRYQDEKEVGDKRPILESPSLSSRKTWSLKDIKNNPQVQREYRREMEGSGFTFSTPLIEDEGEEEEEDQDDEEEENAKELLENKMASPSSKKEGKKKNKRKKKKKQK
ncbi:hypothetical protein RhiirA4_467270 [Rhizophagus irregularis]|uniref:Uncharacterized protein n=1 Tax=Rhizophagus irregularis TaxID=588596 RepID=A0A2I1GVN7_9GLOM|nr:hypothetical protein RhiirA4_467270 [Rhizophagus irregularis]